jgi:hypothetical protein
MGTETFARALVVMASPPTTSGARTLGRMAALQEVLGCADVQIANLFALRAKDVPALTAVGAQLEGWHAARDEIAAGLRECDTVIAAWGLDPLSGSARLHRFDQLAWLGREARDLGHENAWAVGGEPRHPSRWHQYVSDRHGRAGQGPFTERLGRVLVWTPIAKLVDRFGPVRVPGT